MNENQVVGVRKRRSSEEIKRLVVEFEASGLGRNEFCRTRGIALSTLRRHLKNHGWGAAGAKAGSRLVAVELSGRDPKGNPATGCALEVVLGLRCGENSIRSHWVEWLKCWRDFKLCSDWDQPL